MTADRAGAKFLRLMKLLEPLRPAAKRLLPASSHRAVSRALKLPERLLFHPALSRVLAPSNRRRLEALRDRHAGERCFIIGSGPSINRMDLSPLANETTFGFNAFFLVAERLGFLPTYYLVEDPLPAEDNAAEINALQGTTRILPWDLRYCLAPGEATVYVHFDRFYGDFPEPGFPCMTPDAARVVYWGGTVTYMAIQIADFMGFRDLYLLGIDLSYQVPKDLDGPRITSDGDDPNHFHPDYFGKGKRWHDPKVERMQKSFETAHAVLESRGRRLFNATDGGNLRKVPRVDFVSLF